MLLYKGKIDVNKKLNVPMILWDPIGKHKENIKINFQIKVSYPDSLIRLEKQLKNKNTQVLKGHVSNGIVGRTFSSPQGKLVSWMGNIQVNYRLANVIIQVIIRVHFQYYPVILIIIIMVFINKSRSQILLQSHRSAILGVEQWCRLIGYWSSSLIDIALGYCNQFMGPPVLHNWIS